MTIERNTFDRLTDNPLLRSYDKQIQTDLAFYLVEIKGSDNLIVAKLQELQSKAKNTLAFLQKEYHLKNE